MSLASMPNPANLQGNMNGTSAIGTNEGPAAPQTVFLQAEQVSGSEQAVNAFAVGATTTVQRADDVQHDINAQSVAPTAPHANEAHAAIRKRASRKRVLIIGSVAVATILVTAAAMEAAGYTYDDIKWPITVEIMVFTIFLTPAYANAITQ